MTVSENNFEMSDYIKSPLHCDMTHECTATVTHIDEKGWVYCREHGNARKYSHRCRMLTPSEIKTLTAGGSIRYQREAVNHR